MVVGLGFPPVRDRGIGDRLGVQPANNNGSHIKVRVGLDRDDDDMQCEGA